MEAWKEKDTYRRENIQLPLSDLTNSLKNVVQILKRWGLYNNPRCKYRIQIMKQHLTTRRKDEPKC